MLVFCVSVIIVCVVDDEQETDNRSVGSGDEELSAVDEQVEALKREEMLAAKRY